MRSQSGQPLLVGNKARPGNSRDAELGTAFRAPLAEVAHHARKPLQLATLVFKRHRDDVGPEAGAILLDGPAFVSEMACGRSTLQLGLQSHAQCVFVRIERGHVLANRFSAAEAVNAFGA